MKFFTVGALALSATMGLGMLPQLATAQESMSLTFAGGHPEIFLWEKHVRKTFIPVLTEELAKIGELDIKWTQAYAGTLVKVGSEVESFQQGIMDVGHMSGVFNPAQLGLLNVSYAMPFGPADPQLVTKAVEKSLWDNPKILSQMEQAVGIKYIGAGFAIDGYNIAATRPIANLSDLDGMKIGGAGPNLSWLRTTGAVGVQGSYVSFYNDTKTGVYDGHIGWLTAHAPTKMYEVAPYWNKVGFGAMYVGGLGVRLELWESFSKETQQAFLNAATAYTEAYFAEQTVRYEGALAALDKAGSTTVVLDAGDRSQWIAQMPNPTIDWQASSEARGESAVESMFLSSRRSSLSLACLN